MSRPLHEARIDPQETLELIRKLRPFHFQDEDFELFHHWGRLGGNLKRFVDYCNEDEKRRFQLNGNNHLQHQRLDYALTCCQSGELKRGKSFADLAKEACKKFRPF